MTYIKLATESVGDAGDQFTGLDRFGRVVDQRWINGSNTDVDRYQYGYDRHKIHFAYPSKQSQSPFKKP